MNSESVKIYYNAIEILVYIVVLYMYISVADSGFNTAADSKS